jgi:hypothetical protein
MDENQNGSFNSPAIYDDQLIQAAENALRRVDAVLTIKKASLKVTNPKDWTDLEGNPYPNASGSHKIARLFGISWRLDPVSMLMEEGGHIQFKYKGYFGMGNVEIEAIGTRSTSEKFFSQGKGGTKKPLSEIDKGDVEKAALTNCIGNGVTTLLGLKNLSWDDLKEFAGITREMLNKVSYQKDEMSTEAKNQREEIRKMIMEMVGNDEAKFTECLKRVTAFPGRDGKEVPGKTKLEDISEKAVPVTYGKVKTKYEEWKAAHGDGTTGNSEQNPGGQA